MNKNLMIGLGVLAVAGIAYYMYKKPKATTSSNATGFEESEEVSNPLVSGRIKSWGGRMENGIRMCFDDAALKYVPCQTSSNARGAEVSNPPAERNVYVCVEGQRYIRDGVNGLIYVSNHCRKNDTLID
jgi:DNA topoisomerase IB